MAFFFGNVRNLKLSFHFSPYPDTQKQQLKLRQTGFQVAAPNSLPIGVGQRAVEAGLAADRGAAEADNEGVAAPENAEDHVEAAGAPEGPAAPAHADAALGEPADAPPRADAARGEQVGDVVGVALD